MQSQVRFEYNNTAQPRNVTNSSVMRTTALWDAMQIKVLYTYHYQPPYAACHPVLSCLVLSLVFLHLTVDRSADDPPLFSSVVCCVQSVLLNVNTLKGCTALNGKPITELWSVTCHMGPHRYR